MRTICDESLGAGSPSPDGDGTLGITVFVNDVADPEMWAEPGLANESGSFQCREDI